jgi:UDP-4-amino-4-deoxy-L-arabinose-oxoglutarate aminotransferase
VCAEVLACIEALGATAQIIDVADDWLLDCDAAASAVGPRTKAIVFPYVMGIWRDIGELSKSGVPVIEDCAQYFPMEGKDLQGSLTVYSFEATKMMTSGEGGLVLSRSPLFADVLPRLKRFGDSPYRLNLYPMSDLLASLALSQLSRLPQFLARRRAIADLYFEWLADVPGLVLPHVLRRRSIFFRFPIRLTGPLHGKLDALMAAMNTRGVVARRPVDLPLHRMRTSASRCANADRLWDSTISIPLYPDLSDSQARTVALVLREAAAAVRGR